MTKTEQKAIRLTMTTVVQANELARIWGPRKPLSLADVVALAIQDSHGRETRKKTSKNSGDNG